MGTIKTFKNADLKELFDTGAARRIDARLARRVRARLEALDNANGDIRTLYRPGFELHKWKGYDTKWSISVSGPWRITFDWIKNEAHNVDLEQPH
ncbi:MAG TPA: type II toxin-antitoxin system RelE/ParE family toxin [Xanthobacteraceae bacterium]|nr:type II toxin-antitoxin system RelE/ParE family toxin [Xanthobacteraceae bacterium]